MKASRYAESVTPGAGWGHRAAGQYDLIGTSTSGREARTQVTISAGETTRVTLRFEDP